MKRKFLYLGFVLFPGIWCQVMAQQTRIVTLPQAIGSGLKNSHALQISGNKTLTAEAKLQQVKDNALPKAGTSLQYTRLYILNKFEMYTGGAEPAFALPATHFDAMIGMTSVSKEIFGGFAERAAHAAQESLIAVSKLDFERDQSEVRYNIIGLYYNIYKIKKSESILDENLRLLDKKEQEVSNLLREGVVTSNELLKIQLQKSNLEMARVDIRNAQAVALNDLAMLIGEPGIDQLDIDTTINLKLTGISTLETLENTALTSSAEILATHYQSKAAESAMKQLMSAYYPHVDASLMHVYLNPAPNHNFFPERGGYLNALNIGVSVKYGISSLYAMKGKKQEAKIAIVQAEQARLLMSDRVRQEVYSQFRSYQSAIEKINVAEVALKQARRSYELTDSKFRNGLLLSSDLIESQNLLQQAQLNMLSARVEAQVAFYKLEKSTGTTF